MKNFIKTWLPITAFVLFFVLLPFRSRFGTLHPLRTFSCIFEFITTHSGIRIKNTLGRSKANFDSISMWLNVYLCCMVPAFHSDKDLADVLMYAILLADKHVLDIKQIIEDKMMRNNEKYPVEKAKEQPNNTMNILTSRLYFCK